MIVPMVLLVASLPWLKQQPQGLIFLLAGTAASVSVVASVLLSVLQERRQDEWQRSMSRFANQWGWNAGVALVALLLAWPQVRDLIISWIAALAHASAPDRKLVLLAFVAGFMAVVLAQFACTVLLAMGWASWMSRPAREA
jgi:hypothetical protein